MGKWKRLALAGGGLILADQLTKLIVWNLLKPPAGSIKVIPDLFDLTLILNTGVAFGLLAGARSVLRVSILAGMTLLAVALIVLLIYKSKEEKHVLLWGLSLVCGGALGNLIDRIRLGAVVDFLDFYIGSVHWPAFNLADAGTSVGTGIILIALWLDR
ncbi:MAG: signal peptidase II [Deltaproteobacteria bacterium]|nr:signal peptidase II [Deltaproteobacteria bacterium]MBW2053433.1 signal peptidase II [Deltaproteobacteria bacterium]MBW2142131.1 signal peptidase II [Deltaproteobacteria bacterium]MBW2323737.1 signal peptidase II [Deltaproteobacteria bacterium]